MTSSTWTLLDDAHHALRGAVAAIGEHDWALPTPCEQWNVAQVLRHATGDQYAYVKMINGFSGSIDDPFAPAPDRPAEPRAFLEEALSASATAFATVAADAQEVPSPLPLGPMPAELVVGACALDAAVHAWDLAVATRQPSPLTAELAARLMPAARATADPLRGFAYAPALTSRTGDDEAGRLLRHLGRDPEWTP